MNSGAFAMGRAPGRRTKWEEGIGHMVDAAVELVELGWN